MSAPGEFRPLGRLLVDERAAWPVAIGRGGTRSSEMLREAVARVAGAVARRGGGRWILVEDDAFAFAAGLLGAAHAGAQVVIPPNDRAGALSALLPGVAGALCARPLGGLESLPRLDPLDPGPGPAASLGELDPEATLLELFTSGTTGEGQTVTKRLRHLDDEVAVLEETFAARLGARTCVLSSAPPQHLYGLLFRVLWPLAAGRPFCAETFRQPAEGLAALEIAGEVALVATPALLARLGKDDLEQLRPRCRAVFSSGGPLATNVAARVARALGEPPLEVFGSTETGGVAWRQQGREGDEEPWLPLPRVRVFVRGDRLAVRSPFVSAPEGLCITEDRAVLLPDGRFRSLGRADRVVKIGEKRLSLPDMERALCAHPAVREAALVPLARGPTLRVGAIVVSAADGPRRKLARELRAWLADRFDPVLLPRAWRFPSELPRDGRGKLPRAALEALFARPAGAHEKTAPEFVSELRDPDRLRRTLRVPHDLAFLEGHFEGMPLVAGVVQLHWALRAAEEWLGERPRVRSVDALRLVRTLRPGDEFTLALERSPDARRLSFQLTDGEATIASGRLTLEVEDGA